MSITDALQAALAGEHACVYGYGLVGAHAGTREESAARAAYDAHRARRDLVTDQVRARGADPVAALPS